MLVFSAGGSDCYWCSVDWWYLVGLGLFKFSFFPFVFVGSCFAVLELFVCVVGALLVLDFG